MNAETVRNKLAHLIEDVSGYKGNELLRKLQQYKLEPAIWKQIIDELEFNNTPTEANADSGEFDDFYDLKGKGGKSKHEKKFRPPSKNEPLSLSYEEIIFKLNQLADEELIALLLKISHELAINMFGIDSDVISRELGETDISEEGILRELMVRCDRRQPSGCVDGRPIVEQKDQPEGKEVHHGPQFLGGNYQFMYVGLAIARGNGISITKEKMWDFTKQAIEGAGFKSGVHVDNHGEIQKINKKDCRCTGCGFASLVNRDPGLFGLESVDTFEPAEATIKAYEDEINVAELDGHHYENKVIINSLEGTTFFAPYGVLAAEDAFNLDRWAYNKVFEKMADILRNNVFLN